MLLEDLDDHDAAIQIAERIIVTLRQPFRIVGKEVFIGASIGVAFDAPGAGTDQLLRNADLAMYTAKVRGRGRSQVFEARDAHAAVERLEVEADLRPRVRARRVRRLLSTHRRRRLGLDARRRGARALANTRRAGSSAVQFIPLAEETGLILEVGRKVLNAACTQARAWQLELGTVPRLGVSVNLSPRQLADPDLVSDVSKALEASGLPPENLTLEITESAMMHDTDAAVAKLTELKQLGLNLAVDDFGTG